MQGSQQASCRRAVRRRLYRPRAVNGEIRSGLAPTATAQRSSPNTNVGSPINIISCVRWTSCGAVILFASVYASGEDVIVRFFGLGDAPGL